MDGEQNGHARKAKKRTSGPASERSGALRPWYVQLHRDKRNTIRDVIDVVAALTRLRRPDAVKRVWEAHHHGVSLLVITHRERAELYEQQFAAQDIKVTLEAADT